jgi:hypothetical protein
LSFTFARSFFPKPKTKNQRLPLLVATMVLAPPRLPRPGSATRYLKRPLPSSASIGPAAISVTARRSARSVNPDWRDQRPKDRVLNILRTRALCH